MEKKSSHLQATLHRVKIIDNFDPERPSWAKGDNVFLADHPSTYVGYLTRHFYGQTRKYRYPGLKT